MYECGSSAIFSCLEAKDSIRLNNEVERLKDKEEFINSASDFRWCIQSLWNERWNTKGLHWLSELSDVRHPIRTFIHPIRQISSFGWIQISIQSFGWMLLLSKKHGITMKKKHWHNSSLSSIYLFEKIEIHVSAVWKYFVFKTIIVSHVCSRENYLYLFWNLSFSFLVQPVIHQALSCCFQTIESNSECCYSMMMIHSTEN